jgi:hypothetical protein
MTIVFGRSGTGQNILKKIVPLSSGTILIGQHRIYAFHLIEKSGILLKYSNN